MSDSTPPNVRKSVSEAGARIQEIIDTAERVAAQIQADAERDAQAYLEERRREADRLVHSRAAELAEMRNSLVSSASAVEGKAAELLGALDHSLAKVREADARAAAIATPPPPPPAAPPPPPEPVAPQAAPAPVAAQPPPAPPAPPPPMPDPPAPEPPRASSPEPPRASSPEPESPSEPPAFEPVSREPAAPAVAEPADEPAPRIEPDLPNRPLSLHGATPRPVAYPGTAPRTPGPADPPQTQMHAVPDERGSGPGSSNAEAALLRATQLAVAGRERAEIEATIDSEFELGDPRAVVDQILGAS